jgi:hypothetical protein
MLKCKKNKFWLENIPNLFCTFTLLPLQGMSLAAQMNALSRFSIIIFFVLLLLGFRFSGLFLLLSLLFIIILYYIERNNMERFKTEYYSPQQRTTQHTTQRTTQPTTQIGSAEMRDRCVQESDDLSNSRRFCNDERSLDGPKGVFNNPEWMSENQRLVGGANPKTKIPPVVIAPLADLSYWRGTNLVTYPQINQECNTDIYRSGYQISSDYDHNSNYSHQNFQNKELSRQKTLYQYNKNSKENPKENFKENFEFPYLLREKEPGDINTACGYNPDQLLRAGLPSNLSAGMCSKTPFMKQYNENLFTQTIQPGIYTRNEINEPINSNIGISFNQQFQPTTSRTDILSGNINYTQHDPRIIEPLLEHTEPLFVVNEATEADIYDPRFTGYGTSYRSYTDDNIGQTRFYYNDVDAIRMPNYITRSHIDNQPFADHYGPLPSGSANGNPYTANIHDMANDAFLQGALQHRTEISERLMRKVNSEQWQRRSAPIRTNNMRMLGGMS